MDKISLTISIIAVILSGISIFLAWRTSIPHIRVVKIFKEANGIKKILVVNTGYYRSVIMPNCGIIYKSHEGKQNIPLPFGKPSVRIGENEVSKDVAAPNWYGNTAIKTIEAKEAMYIILDRNELHNVLQKLQQEHVSSVRFYVTELSCICKKPIKNTSQKIKIETLL